MNEYLVINPIDTEETTDICDVHIFYENESIMTLSNYSTSTDIVIQTSQDDKKPLDISQLQILFNNCENNVVSKLLSHPSSKMINEDLSYVYFNQHHVCEYGKSSYEYTLPTSIKILAFLIEVSLLMFWFIFRIILWKNNYQRIIITKKLSNNMKTKEELFLENENDKYPMIADISTSNVIPITHNYSNELNSLVSKRIVDIIEQLNIDQAMDLIPSKSD